MWIFTYIINDHYLSSWHILILCVRPDFWLSWSGCHKKILVERNFGLNSSHNSMQPQTFFSKPTILTAIYFNFFERSAIPSWGNVQQRTQHYNHHNTKVTTPLQSHHHYTHNTTTITTPLHVQSHHHYSHNNTTVTPSLQSQLHYI